METLLTCYDSDEEAEILQAWSGKTAQQDCAVPPSGGSSCLEVASVGSNDGSLLDFEDDVTLRLGEYSPSPMDHDDDGMDGDVAKDTGRGSQTGPDEALMDTYVDDSEPIWLSESFVDTYVDESQPMPNANVAAAGTLPGCTQIIPTATGPAELRDPEPEPLEDSEEAGMQCTDPT